MKRFLPSILILLILVNLFAPFSVEIGKNHRPIIKTSIVKADETIIPITVTPSPDGTSAEISGEFSLDKSLVLCYGMFYWIGENPNDLKVDNGGGILCGRGGALIDLNKTDTNGIPIYGYKYTFTGLTGGNTYYVKADITAFGIVSQTIQGVINSSVVSFKAGTTEIIKKEGYDPSAVMPACGIGGTEGIFNTGIGSGTITGCAAQLIYYVLFVPTSFLFALTGTFFDWTFHYTIQDSSYSSGFVVEGWGIVRDFCNVFFIFVLLYIAFRTILGLGGGHGPNTKQMIINVVIIGLLINFSLFASQVIIDSSNILARVFYNSNSIKITENGANGVTNSTPKLKVGPNGELPLSAALVNKVNPQNLIIHSSRVGPIKDEGGKGDVKNIGAGTFILITLLAVIVNVVGMIVFFSVGIMCIARVIGLWLYMIFAPLAFFSYTVPQMQGLKMIGWKNWWSQLLCFSFWAPLFIFFLYLILKFLETGFDLIGTQDKEGLQFVIAIVVPFAFIMMLLWRAKNLANSMGCEIAGQITGGIAAIGGIALGGAALGAAALGRNTVGAFMKGASTGDTAARRLANNDPTLTRFERIKGRLAQISGVDWAQQRVGTRLNRNQHDINHAAHARSELNKVAGEIAHGKKWDELNGEERFQARRKLARDRYVRDQGPTNGWGTRKWDALSDTERDTVDTHIGIDAHGQAVVGGQMATHQTFDDTHTIRDSRRKERSLETIIQSTVTGSFDARNISKIETRENDSIMNKIVSGITSNTASGMRNIFEQSNINYGTGQKDFFKDLANTITEALKSAKIKVDLSHVGSEVKEGDGGHH